MCRHRAMTNSSMTCGHATVYDPAGTIAHDNCCSLCGCAAATMTWWPIGCPNYRILAAVLVAAPSASTFTSIINCNVCVYDIQTQCNQQGHTYVSRFFLAHKCIKEVGTFALVSGLAVGPRSSIQLGITTHLQVIAHGFITFQFEIDHVHAKRSNLSKRNTFVVQ